MESDGRILVLAFGNPGRQDDGLGPAAAEILASLELPGVTVEADYQLMVEDAARIAEHSAVVFIDATRGGPEPYALERVLPAPDAHFSTHASQPGALLALAKELYGRFSPGFLVAIRGYEFDDFGEQLSVGARHNLSLAVQFLADLLGREASARLTMLERCATPAAAETEETMAHKQATVLLVDDDPDVRDVIRTILEAHGFVCHTAASAEEGVQRFGETQPDLIIADLMMEEVDSGTGFVRSLKLVGNKAPVFMLSSVGNALSMTVEPSALGLAGIFQKPVDPETLVQTLRAALREPPLGSEPNSC